MPSRSTSSRACARRVAGSSILAAIAAWAPAAAAPAQTTITLTGVVRDFRDRFVPGGHPDFEGADIFIVPYKYVGFLVEPTLGADGLPAFSGTGGWTLVASPTANPLNDVCFVDQFKGWAVGENGTIIRSTDAGVSWTPQNSGVPAGIGLKAIQMHNATIGWAVGASGRIVRTGSGGLNWVSVSTAGANLFDVQFPVGDQIGYAVGGVGTVLYSDDSGVNWIAKPQAVTGARINAIWFWSATEGVAVGQNGLIMKTDDGAGTWTQVMGIADGTEFRDVHFPTATVGYACGTGNTVLRSIDGGDTWTEILNGAGDIRALDFPTGSLIGAYGASGGRLGQTENGGASWAEQAMSPNWFNGIDCVSPTVAVAVGGNGTIARLIPAGRIISAFATDSMGNQIAPQMFNAALGDTPETLGPPSDGSVQSEASFNQWFRDVLGVNLSTGVSITLNQQPDGTFRFDSALDEPYAGLGGFFPIENALYGNPGTQYKPGAADRNYHFTFHGRWRFRYNDTAGQFFTFAGDDDVFVYINDLLVIDLGGVHYPREQVVDIDRLGLTNNDVYDMDFFFAERHCCGSNMRITTNLPLESLSMPTINGSAD